MPTTTITADQQYAKHIARRHDHATRLLSIAHESDRQRLRNVIAALEDEREAHLEDTGWAYSVGHPGNAGYWNQRTYPHGPQWTMVVRTITDEGDQP